MSSEYFTPSNAVARAKSGISDEGLWASIKDRFEGCPAGMSFAVKLGADRSDNYLRSLISKKAKVYNRRFVVVKQADGWYEVSRVSVEAKPDQSEWTEPK